MTAAREWWETKEGERATAQPAPPRKRIPLRKRFWSKVDKSLGPNGCWIWKAGVNSAGYGAININGVMELAHRVAFVLRHGRIGGELYILHSLQCTTKLCCNWRHLRQGTQSDNMRDFWKMVHSRHRKPSKALGPLA